MSAKLQKKLKTPFNGLSKVINYHSMTFTLSKLCYIHVNGSNKSLGFPLHPVTPLNFIAYLKGNVGIIGIIRYCPLHVVTNQV